jgi:hypothetical protein
MLLLFTGTFLGNLISVHVDSLPYYDPMMIADNTIRPRVSQNATAHPNASPAKISMAISRKIIGLS